MIALKCPICGAPVPPSKGVKPRKFCSPKCTQKAANRYRTERGDRNKKTCRRVCAFCGAVFMSKGNSQNFCSRVCAMRARGVAGRMRLKEIAEKRERKRRQAESCRETAPVTVEERDGIRIETRGRLCIGFHAKSFFKHV